MEEFRRQLDSGMWAAVPTARGRPPRGDHGARLLRGPARRRAGGVLPAGGRRLSVVVAVSGRRRGGLAVGFGRRARGRPARAHPARRVAASRRPATTPGASAGPSARRASCCARSSPRASTRCTPSSASSASPGRADGGYAYLRLPAPPDRRLRHRERRAAERVLRRLSAIAPSRPLGERLPDADDVLAKWMSLRGGERELIARGEHARARPPGRPRPGPARPGSPAASGAGAAPGRRVERGDTASPHRGRARAPSSTGPTGRTRAPT